MMRKSCLQKTLSITAASSDCQDHVKSERSPRNPAFLAVPQYCLYDNTAWMKAVHEGSRPKPAYEITSALSGLRIVNTVPPPRRFCHVTSASIMLARERMLLNPRPCRLPLPSDSNPRPSSSKVTTSTGAVPLLPSVRAESLTRDAAAWRHTLLIASCTMR